MSGYISARATPTGNWRLDFYIMLLKGTTSTCTVESIACMMLRFLRYTVNSNRHEKHIYAKNNLARDKARVRNRIDLQEKKGELLETR